MLSATLDLLRDKIRSSNPGWAHTTDGGAVGIFSPFYLTNEGGCTDVFFFDENTGVVSGTLFDGQGALQEQQMPD